MPDSEVQCVLMTGDIVGGVWTFTLELAGALAAHGVETVLAAMGGEPSAAQRAQAEETPGLRLLASAWKLEWMDDPWHDVAESGRWLLDLQKQFRPDIIHLNTYGHGALAWLCPVVLTAHSCVLSWWQAVKDEPLPARWDSYRSVVARSLRAADVLTAPSQAMLDAIERHYGPGLPAQRLVIPNGRRADRFHAAAKEPMILTAGRLRDEGKNATAMAAVAGRLPWPATRRILQTAICWGLSRLRSLPVGMRAPQFMLCRRAMSLSASRRWRRHYPDARSCWAISQACAKSGRMPRSMSARITFAASKKHSSN